MSRLPYTLYRAAEVRELDRIAIQEFGIPGIELMNRAGAALFDELCSRWPAAGRIAVVCGGGNNAGDGYVVARLAREKGFAVTLLALIDPARLKGDAKTAWGAARAAGLTVTAFAAAALDKVDVIVDAVFGTGLDRPVEGRWAEAIDAINAAAVPVLAVDIPSGLQADTGRAMGVAVKATATVSFIGLKQGLFTGSGPDHCGVLSYHDLGVPAAVLARVPAAAERVDWLGLRSSLPPRLRTAHKGMCGHVLVVGGNHGMAGAVRMAAEAAARVGSGLTSVATRPGHVAAMASARPELMWRGISCAAELRELLRHATVVAIGPGLGQDGWATTLFETVLQSGLPLVVDADGLNLLAQAQEPCRYGDWVLTPHPGEAARLLQTDTGAIHEDRFAALAQLSQRYAGTVVLKGAGTLIGDEQGTVALCSGGNPGMASGGMGDVLTGVIAGLAAQGLGLSLAARAGVSLHAAAGDKVALSGERGMLAGDVVKALRALVN